MVKAGKPEKRHGRPYRGIEVWTQKGGQRFRSQAMRTIDVVMDKQDAQWAADFDNEFRIAAMSANVTAETAQRALLIAQQDEREAITIRGTFFDDVNIVTEDESIAGMANLVVKKRRRQRSARKERKAKKIVAGATQMRRTTRKENNRESLNDKNLGRDPPGARFG
jgi:hypothetical protein